MKQIRQGVFETNSSSTHTISISGNALNDIPDYLYFDCNDFGWECDVHDTVEDRASYLWTYIFHNYSNSSYPTKEDGSFDYSQGRIYTFTDEFYAWKERLTNICKEVGVREVDFQEAATMDGIYDDTGYIDHSEELSGFVHKLWEDDYLLKQYLFCGDSGIETGNDNDDYGLCFKAENEIYDYYKGN